MREGNSMAAIGLPGPGGCWWWERPAEWICLAQEDVMKPRTLLLALVLAAFPMFGSSSGCDSGGEPEPVWLEEEEPNDTVAEANDVVLYGMVSGAMAPGDVDVFRLEIPASYDGYKVTLAVADEPGDCFTGVDPNLELRASDGITVLDRVEDAIEDYCPELQFVPRPGDIYYVVVGTAYTLAGDYLFSVLPEGTGTISGTVDTASLEGSLHVAASPGGAAALAAASPLAVRGVLDGEPEGKGGEPPEPRAVVSEPTVPCVDGEAIIGPMTRAPDARFASRLAAWVGLPLERLGPILGGRYYLARFALPPGLDGPARQARTRRVVTRLETFPEVGSVTTNGLLQPAVEPDDALYGEQWGLQAYPGIDAVGAWDVTTGSADVVVAVIDTGDDANHPDLKEKSVPGFDFISDPDNAGDANGVDPVPDDNLRQSHGVHVAGIAAAATNNGEGVAGVGWQTSYMPLRVCGNYGCTFADVIEAIGYAVGLETVAGPGLPEPRAGVINLSLGGNDRCPGPLQDAITAATSRGVVVVAAAGNGSEDASLFTPANCADVIAVGATGDQGERADFSNFGATVDVYAPGDGILSTLYGGEYGVMRGTSMATPHVSGIVALLEALDPNYATESVLDVLTASCPADGCVDPVDARAVLERAAADPPLANDLPPLVLVQAVSVTDPARSYYTFAREGAFTLEGLEPGTYLVQAGTDTDGDFVLGEASESFGLFPQTFTITSAGEDVVGLEIALATAGE